MTSTWHHFWLAINWVFTTPDETSGLKSNETPYFNINRKQRGRLPRFCWRFVDFLGWNQIRQRRVLVSSSALPFPWQRQSLLTRWARKRFHGYKEISGGLHYAVKPCSHLTSVFTFFFALCCQMQTLSMNIITARNEVGARLYFHRRLWFCSQGGVCLSACWDTTPPPGTSPPPPQTRHPPAQSMLGDTVNARAVCILLECNLVICCHRTILEVWRKGKRRR